MAAPAPSLAERYFEASLETPDSLRARKPLEDELAKLLTGGQHVAVRGFWRIGKTTLARGMLARACERTGGAAFYIDLRDPERDDGQPQSKDEALGRVAARTQEFLARVGAEGLKSTPNAPFAILGELAAPIFIAVDELIALAGLGAGPAGEVLEALLTTPKNVRLVLVCHRHRDVDALFEQHILSRPNVHGHFVLPISDDELVELVQTPAQELGLFFENEALGELATLSGNRPWELHLLAGLVAEKLKPDFQGGIGPAAIEPLYSLDALTEHEAGGALVENVLRILVTAMTPEERAVVELLATGGEGEVAEDAVASLEQAGWLSSAEGFQLVGALFEGIARGVAEGEIRVSVE